MPTSPRFVRQGVCGDSCGCHASWVRKVAIYRPQPPPQLRHAMERQLPAANYDEHFVYGCLCRVEGNPQSLPNRHAEYLLPDEYLCWLALSQPGRQLRVQLEPHRDCAWTNGQPI